MSDIDISPFVTAIKNRKPLPSFPKGLSHSASMDMQKQITDAINQGMTVGWKAGVTNPAMMNAFGLSEPLIGGLYTAGRIENGSTIQVVSQQKIECEIAVVLNQDGHPKLICPAIELVYMAFSNPADLTPANAVAANIGADRYLLGTPIPWNPDLDRIDIRLEKDGKVVLETSTESWFKSIKDGVTWMLEKGKTQDMGFAKTQDHILLLGTCGQAMPANSGQYRANFEGLGEVSFSVGNRY